MLLTNRVIFEDDTTLNDLSVKLNTWQSGTETLPIVAADDAIYIGSDAPFSFRFLKVSTVNDQASVASVALWDGSAWQSAVDVIDETAISGVTLAQSGNLRWKKSKDYSWAKQDTEDMTGSGLTTLKIYGLYWAKITFSADLKNTTALQYVGHKFASDEELQGFYPDLTSTVAGKFQSGKTTWDDQLIAASEVISRKLQSEGRTYSRNSILNPDLFTEACVHKAAEIIYSAFGDDYKDNREESKKNFKEAMEVGNFQIDFDQDTVLDPSENTRVVGLVRR